ncbi:unnamed protein product, partial [Vitis vinifera]|uniref:Uncharacterized protein n=1 Tax=Vitis vinifera TaxID=29760 RepID=D7TLJ0_VITVI
MRNRWRGGVFPSTLFSFMSPLTLNQRIFDKPEVANIPFFGTIK